jgi:hypothetical protein
MTPRTKKTAAALTGALVLASGAYALGSQAGGGSALAGDTNQAGVRGTGYGLGPGPGHRGFRGGPRQALADAARQLGVSEAELLAALRKLRDEKRGELDALRDAFAKQLAAELGVSQSKVESALDDRAGGRKLRRTAAAATCATRSPSGSPASSASPRRRCAGRSTRCTGPAARAIWATWRRSSASPRRGCAPRCATSGPAAPSCAATAGSA